MASSQPDREIWYVSSIEGVRYVRSMLTYAFLQAGKFSRGALAFIRPVIPRPRASTAYNQINAVIREQALNVIH